MARALIALICGVASSFLLIGLLSFLTMNLKIYPFYDFYLTVQGNSQETFFALAQKIVYVFVFVIFPIISFVSSFLTALLAKQKEILLGILSLLPLYAVFNLYPGSFSNESIYELITFLIFAVVGSYVAKVLNKRRSSYRNPHL